jgi:hypothetical protein
MQTKVKLASRSVVVFKLSSRVSFVPLESFRVDIINIIIIIVRIILFSFSPYVHK